MSRVKRNIFILLFFIFVLLVPQQKTLGKNELSNDSIYRWINNISQPQANTLAFQSINSELNLVTYEIRSKYYGYLIVSNNGEIFEYGEGRQIPYQARIIINSDIQKYKLNNLVYISAIESYWELNTAYGKVFVEGNSGEWLFDLTNINNEPTKSHSLNLKDKITCSYVNKDLLFDPYLNFLWLFDNTMQKINTKENLKNILDSNKRIIFIGKKYNQHADFAYPIIGYNIFNNKLYIATYDVYLSIVRYISFEDLNNYGNFFIYNDQ